MKKPSIKELMNIMPQTGRVEWIGIRPERRASVQPVQSVEAVADTGLSGDHHDNPGGKRQATLIQAEHLDVVASILSQDQLDPALTRRNIVVKGLNLLALKDRRFAIGGAVLEVTGECVPCSRMEENFGPGGYNAMRGHGGVTAKIISGGAIAVGDMVRLLPQTGEDV
ncbi:MAG: MOSC domain-containing protein [Saprospiraceae bacterium]|nr:MOSC domain-containing protein [Saprospiraceae bacterium]